MNHNISHVSITPFYKGENMNQRDNMRQAAELLRHDLVWSQDFEAIRLDLAEYIESKSTQGIGNHPALIRLVDKLLDAEFRLQD